MNRYSQNKGRGRAITMDDVRRLVAENKQLRDALEGARRESADVDDELRSLGEALRRAEAREESATRESEELRAEVEKLRSELEQQRQLDDERVKEAEQVAAGPEDSGELAEEALDRLRHEIADLTNDLARVRRNAAGTEASARRSERGRLLAGLGDVLDSVDIALQTAAPDDAWTEGLRAIQRQLHRFFEREGATLTGKVGEEMDPRVHEALGVVDADDIARGNIVRVHRPGIELDDGTVVRPAQVLVAS